MKKICLILLSVLLITTSLNYTYADAQTVDVAYLTVDGEACLYKNFFENGERQELSYYIGAGKVSTSYYVATNSCVKIVESNGKSYIEPRSTGTGLVIFYARLADQTSLSITMIVTVCKEEEELAGKVNKNVIPLRSMYLSPDVSENKLDTIQPYTKVKIIGSYGDYYLVSYETNNLANAKLNQEAYILKSDINILVTSIVAEDEYSLKVGESLNMDATVLPENATNKRLLYASDNTDVVTVDENGCLNGLAAGEATVTITSKDRNAEKKCRVVVTSDEKENESETEPSSDEDDKVIDDNNFDLDNEMVTTGNNTEEDNKIIKDDTNAVKKKKAKITARGKTDKRIIIKWSGFKSVKKYKLQRATGKKFKTIKTLSRRKKSYTDTKVKFYKKYKYRLLVIKIKEKNEYSRVVSARTKDSKVDIILQAKPNTVNSIKLSWNKQKHVKEYEIQRKTINIENKYRKIKVVNANKKTYTDKTVKYGKKYSYKIIVKKKNGKESSSNAAKSISKIKCDTKHNIEYFKKNYPFVCLDANVDINSYCPYENYYPPIKYQFDGETLKIHLYVYFVTYKGNQYIGYEKEKASREKGIDGKSFIELYKEGVKDNFEIAICNNKYEFVSLNFRTEVVFHEKSLDKYNAKQVFNEILIGGEDPFRSKEGDHWYHEHPSDDGTFSRIYMPFINQLKDNVVEAHRVGMEYQADYSYTSAHETGHALGLSDAYYEKYDRFTDNEETGYKCVEKTNKGEYDNLMKEQEWDKTIKPNDLEMMFLSYKISEGKPWLSFQAYKTVEELGMVISPCIVNKNDLYRDID